MDLVGSSCTPSSLGGLPSVLPIADQTVALRVLQEYLPPSGRLLHFEASAGAFVGQVATSFAGWRCRPVVDDERSLVSVAAWRVKCGVPNFEPALFSSITSLQDFQASRVDAALVGPGRPERDSALPHGLRAAGRVVRDRGLVFLLALDAKDLPVLDSIAESVGLSSIAREVTEQGLTIVVYERSPR